MTVACICLLASLDIKNWCNNWTRKLLIWNWSDPRFPCLLSVGLRYTGTHALTELRSHRGWNPDMISLACGICTCSGVGFRKNTAATLPQAEVHLTRIYSPEGLWLSVIILTTRLWESQHDALKQLQEQQLQAFNRHVLTHCLQFFPLLRGQILTQLFLHTVKGVLCQEERDCWCKWSDRLVGPADQAS